MAHKTPIINTPDEDRFQLVRTKRIAICCHHFIDLLR